MLDTQRKLAVVTGASTEIGLRRGSAVSRRRQCRGRALLPIPTFFPVFH